MASLEKMNAEAKMALVALGSNLGNRQGWIGRAMVLLGKEPHTLVHKSSGMYETKAMYNTDQPDFLNAVVQVHTQLEPEALLSWLLELEECLGRVRDPGVAKGPRTIDLDLVAYEDQVIDTPSLTLPHPGLGERLFVLMPLVEVAPEWEHPATKQSSKQMLAVLLAEVGEEQQECVRLGVGG